MIRIFRVKNYAKCRKVVQDKIKKIKVKIKKGNIVKAHLN